MTLEEMIQSVFFDTQVSDAAFNTDKLNSAQDWVWARLMVMDENVLKVSNDQNTMAAQTSSYDLAANVTTGTLYQIKWLGVKFSGETEFSPVEFIDSSSNRFIAADQSTTTAGSHPVLVAIENFNEVRFAPPLASGTIIRTDYIYKPVAMGLATHANCDLPEPFHRAVVDKAIGESFLGIDDDRVARYELRALDKLYGALNVLGVRQTQQPFRTRPSSRGVGRRAF